MMRNHHTTTDAALADLISRCADAPDAVTLREEWRSPLAAVARDLASIDQNYRLSSLRWDERCVRIRIEYRDMPCCAEAWTTAAWDAHFENGSVEHQREIEALEEREWLLDERCRRAFHESLHWGEPPRPEPADLRPVVALDIDGVLNPVSRAPLRRVDVGGVPHVLIDGMLFPAGEEETPPKVRDLPSVVVHVPHGSCSNPFFAGASRDVDVRVRFDPQVVQWVCSLHERAEVVWATTWERAANLFADAVGLPHARVGISHEHHPVKLSHLNNGDAAGWKGGALAEEFANRPLVWIDDLAAIHKQNLFWRLPDDVRKTLVVVPEEHVGITHEHIAEVEVFLDRWSAGEHGALAKGEGDSER